MLFICAVFVLVCCAVLFVLNLVVLIASYPFYFLESATANSTDKKHSRNTHVHLCTSQGKLIFPIFILYKNIN